MMIVTHLFFLALFGAPSDPATYDGFGGAEWGSTPDAVRQTVGAATWRAGGAAAEFPKELDITTFSSAATIAGYPARVTYYFWNDKFFQATVRFDFDDLSRYDFNYNVFRSVNEYYNEIRGRTLVFVRDIYDLLRKKYGKQRPYFTGIDPRNIFRGLDANLKRESWNLRYHPYDYYLHIAAQGYARWDFPKTRALFSIVIRAPDKRFEYTLSLASLALAGPIGAAKDSLRMRGL